MIAFEVNDMTCGHCVSTITRALNAADKDAQVEIDLSRHLVQIQPVGLSAEELSDVIKEAGYTPMPVQASLPGNAPARGGRCGGCC